MRTYNVLKGVLALSLAAALGCSGGNPAPGNENKTGWLKDGMIVLSRPAPAVSALPPQRLLGFAPFPAARVDPWLSISTADRTISLMEGDKILLSSRGEGIENLQPGLYQILHKQLNALWYAPDSYFKSRNLPLPPEGDRSRYRRGALGDFALYITRDTPIHDGPVWDSDIGGIRVPENDISGIYYRLAVGAVVEVK